MPLPRAHSQRQVHASQSKAVSPLSPAAAIPKSASAATSPRSAASPSCVSPGSAKSPSTEYVKSRLKKLYMSPKASKMPPLQNNHIARLTLSPIASPAESKARLPHIEQSTELPARSLSSSPSISTSSTHFAHSSSDPTSVHSHSPLLAPLPSSLTASPLRPPAHLPAHASLPVIAAPSSSYLSLPPGQLLPDHLSPRWAELRKDEEEEHKESEQDDETMKTLAIPQATQNEHENKQPDSSPHSPSPTPLPDSFTSALSVQPVAPISLPLLATSAAPASDDPSLSSSASSATHVLPHAMSLPPVLEVERETSSTEANTELDKASHDGAQQVLRSASMPLSPRSTAPSQPLPPPALPIVVIDTSTDWEAARGRLKASSVTRIERLTSPMETGRTIDEPSEANNAIPEGDEAVESLELAAPTQLSIDATSPTESSVEAETAPLTTTLNGRHNSIEGVGDYPLSPLSAAQAFDTLAAQNASIAPLQLSQPQFSPMPHPLQMQQMAHLAQPYGTPHMAGFAPALSAHPFAMHPAYGQLPPPALPGLPMPGLPYGAHPMDAHYQHYMFMQQQQQQQQQHAMMAAAVAAQAEPPRSYSQASFHTYSPAPFTRSPSQTVSYTPHQQMHYVPTPAHYAQAPATFSQSRLSLASVHSPSPIPASPYTSHPPPLSRTASSSGNLTDTQARLSFFRDIANNRHADVKEQLERGMTPHCTDRNGNTPLHIACQHGLRRIVKSLLRCGADINAGNREGNTPLHMCYGYHYEELGDYLKSKGANDRKLNVFGMSCYDGLKPSGDSALDSPSQV